MRPHEIRLQADGGAKGGGRIGKPVLLHVGDAQPVVRLSGARIPGEHQLILDDGGGGITALLQHEAQGETGLVECGTQPEGGVGGTDGARQVPRAAAGESETEVGARVERSQLQRAFETGGRGLPVLPMQERLGGAQDRDGVIGQRGGGQPKRGSHCRKKKKKTPQSHVGFTLTQKWAPSLTARRPSGKKS